MRLSVIVPTFNRHDRVAHTLKHLRHQTLPSAEYEIIVIDDGSTPPVVLPEAKEGPSTTLIRFDEILERCVARNVGAERARGEVLAFLDDDLEVNAGFLNAHLRAHEEWPDALVAGAIILPLESLSLPFVRFRQNLEKAGVPLTRGVTTSSSVGAAGNLSIQRERYLKLGGFSTELVGIEDADFTARHVAAGGKTVYLPEAVAIHWDHALDIRSYCRRTEWAAECAVNLTRRYPDWPINQERGGVNGPTHWGREPLRRSLSKAAKQVLGLHPFLDALFGCTWLLERSLPNSRLLARVYSMLIGIHWLHGYRRGLRRLLPIPTESDLGERTAPHLEESKA